MVPPELEGLPELPEYLEYLWDWFFELDRKRTHSFAGFNPITWEAIQAWAYLTKRNLKEWELQALDIIDSAYLRSIHTPE